MKNKLMTMGVGLLVMATPMLAQGAADAASSAEATRKAAAYLSVGIASGLCGLGQGRALPPPPKRWHVTLERLRRSAFRCLSVWRSSSRSVYTL